MGGSFLSVIYGGRGVGRFEVLSGAPGGSRCGSGVVPRVWDFLRLRR